jgi:phage shock protein PspC (stress-responsive transcriptional regulator)
MQKKLYRNTNNKMLSGVCAGLADYLNVDVTIVRLIVVAVSVFLGAIILGLIAYAVCAIVLPLNPAEQTGAVPPVYPQQPPVYTPPAYTPPVQPAPYQPPVAPAYTAPPVPFQDISSTSVPEQPLEGPQGD